MGDNVHVLDYKNISLPQDVVDKIIRVLVSHEDESVADLIYRLMSQIGNDFSTIPFVPIMRRNENEIILMDQSTYYTVESRRSFPMGFLTLKRDIVLEVLLRNGFGFEQTINFTLVKEVNFIVDKPDSIICDNNHYVPRFYQENIYGLRIGGIYRSFSTLTELGVNLF